MFKTSIKYVLILLVVLVSSLWGQIATQKVNVDLFPYLNLLLSRAYDDVTSAVLDNKINERVAITRFESTGIEIEDKYRTLIIKSFEEIRLENKFFHLVGNIEALNKTIIVNSGLELYTTEELSEMQRYSMELNADYYAIVNAAVVDKTISLTLIIRNAREHTIIWGKKWSTVLRKGTTSFNAGFYQGITLGAVNFPNIMFPFRIHLGVDWKIFNFVDFGFYFDPGANLLYPSDSTSSDPIIGFSVDTGIKVAIDLLNMFKSQYKNLEIPIHVRAGFNVHYNISHLIPVFANIPILSITARPGISFIFNRDYSVFVEFDPEGLGTGESAIFTGFFYRTEF